MAIPKLLNITRKALQDTGKNTITDGSIGLSDSNSGANFQLTLNGISSMTYQPIIADLPATDKLKVNYSSNASTATRDIYYSSQVVADNIGQLTLVNPQVVTITTTGTALSEPYLSILVNKYCTNLYEDQANIYYCKEPLLGRTMGDGAWVVEMLNPYLVSAQSNNDNAILASFENESNTNVRLKNIADPTDLQDAVTKNYINTIELNLQEDLQDLKTDIDTVEVDLKEYVDNSGGIYYADMTSSTDLQLIDQKYIQNKNIILTDSSGEMVYLNGVKTLPDGYTPLEYIETNGNAYIDTGYFPNNKTAIHMDFQFTRDVAAHIFGARTASQNDAFAICFESDFGWCLQINDSIYNGGIFDRSIRHKIILNADYFQIDGNINTTINASASSFTSGGSLYIAACSNSTIPDENMYGKIYQFAIVEEDDFKSLFVPAKNPSGAIGLYDLLQNRFFSSAGSQAFTAGPSLSVNCSAYYFAYPTTAGKNVAVGYYYVVPQNTYCEGYATTASRLIGPTEGTIYHNFTTLLAADNGYYRPIRVSTQEPTASDGNVGDIWIVYTE